MLDEIDVKIVKELEINGRISMKELGNKVHLTGQAVSARVLKLEDSGVIKGYTIELDLAKAGYLIHTLIHVFIKHTSHKRYLNFVDDQREFIIHNYKISGECCYILECKFTSNRQLNQFLLGLNQHANYKLSHIIDE